MRIKQWFVNKFGFVTIEQHNFVLETLKDIMEHQIKKLIEQDDRVKQIAILGQYKLELVMKHGCFDCFALSDEWHNDNCPSGVDVDGNRQLVRRNNGRQPAGHS